MKKSPCYGQTAEAIETWLRTNAQLGVELVVRRTQFHMLEYTKAKVTGFGRGRIYTDQGSFYYSGKNCFQPKGQTRLVIPTPETLASCYGRPVGLCTDFEMTFHG